MRGDLLLGGHRPATGARVRRQNPTMLAVTLESDVLVRAGSVVATTGEVHLAPDDAAEPELWRGSGRGDVFAARDGHEVHVLWLEDAGLVVDPAHLLALDAALTRTAQPTGDRPGVAVHGSGWVAVLTAGTPVVLDATAGGTVAADAVVARSATVQVEPRPLAGGTGEVTGLAVSGSGVVVVQADAGS